MIRRDGGDGWILIEQHEHALLAGRIAQHVGGRRFEPLQERVLRGISMHDAGWPVHDQSPTLDSQGRPRDVFQSTLPLAIEVWSGGPRAVPADEPYAQLLVSVHVLTLSAMAVTRARRGDSTLRMDDRNSVFMVNKFQHQQFEMQEHTRKALGMRLDVPLTLGIADDSNDPLETQLVYDARWLAAADMLSLSLCCDQPPVKKIEPLLASPGGRATPLYVKKPSADVLQVDPWPFTADRLELTFPCRRVQGRTWADDASFHRAYAQATQGTLNVTIEPVKGWW